MWHMNLNLGYNIMEKKINVVYGPLSLSTIIQNQYMVAGVTRIINLKGLRTRMA